MLKTIFRRQIKKIRNASSILLPQSKQQFTMKPINVAELTLSFSHAHTHAQCQTEDIASFIVITINHLSYQWVKTKGLLSRDQMPKTHVR